MKTIRIIDLLNKSVNDEKLPKKIKIQDDIYELTTSNNDYYNDKNNRWFTSQICSFGFLTEEVEIIEEDKKIEKLKIDSEDRIQALSTGNFAYKVNQPTKNIIYKINELIDEVNKIPALKRDIDNFMYEVNRLKERR